MTVRVKICGLTTLDDALMALDAGADYLGFIFYPKSKRYVDRATVRGILNAPQLKGRDFQAVGVFVNESPALIAEALDECNLDLAQIHGQKIMDAELVTGLVGRVYYALQPRNLDEAQQLAVDYALPGEEHRPDILLDTYSPQQYGGTGRTGDWQVGAALARQYRILLAGGLTPANVARAVSVVQPWGVDVASGVEASPGIKDHRAVIDFIQAAKRPDQGEL